MYVCMHVLNRISQLLALSFSQTQLQGGEAPRSESCLGGGHGLQLIRTRTLTSLSPSSSPHKPINPSIPSSVAQPKLRSCSICSAHAHVSPLGQPDPRVKLI
ncbi:hypothetical protein J3E69DRAFT_52217 [Trichoderma sp. SZMC 28015]